jgi:hypothetical protein
MTELESQIRDAITNKDYVSFAELSRMEGFDGDLAMATESHPNIIWWAGMSREAVDILVRLERDGFFHFHLASWLIYMIDGRYPNMPIATQKRNYKTLHWLPLTLKSGSGPCKDKECPRRKEKPKAMS